MKINFFLFLLICIKLNANVSLQKSKEELKIGEFTIHCSDHDDLFFDDIQLNEKKITIKSASAHVQDIIELISTAIGVNFVIDPKVQGNLGKILFKDVTAGHILKFICSNNDPQLCLIKDNDIWHIVTRESIIERHQKKIIHKAFELHYINPTDKFKEIIEKTWNNIVSEKEKSIAYMSIDTERKKIFCRASQRTIDEFKQFLSEIDKQVIKVKIDAVIVVAEKNSNFDFGINWSGIYNRLKTIQLKCKNFDFVGLGGILTDFPEPTKPLPGNDNLFVNPENFALNLFSNHCKSVRTPHPHNMAPIKIPFVFGGPDLNLRRLNLLLNAAEIECKAKIISRPSVITNNNEVAKILIGESLPIQTGRIDDLAISTTGGSIDYPTVSYKDIGISLEVYPIVSPDKTKVKLEIFLEESEIVKGNTTTNDKGVMQDPPVIDMIKIHNKVTLENGQTVIIGGLSTYDERKAANRVPWLYKIPFFGKFFEGISESQREFEQYVFITPTIVTSEYSDCETCKI